MSSERWKKENIEKVRKYRRDWYYRNKDIHRRSKQLRKKEIRKWLKELKSFLKCNRCDENDPCCMEFHHKDPAKKENSITNAVHNGWSKKHILSEIDKCEVLCANCHKKEHFSKFFIKISGTMA